MLVLCQEGEGLNQIGCCGCKDTYQIASIALRDIKVNENRSNIFYWTLLDAIEPCCLLLGPRTSHWGRPRGLGESALAPQWATAASAANGPGAIRGARKGGAARTAMGRHGPGAWSRPQRVPVQ